MVSTCRYLSPSLTNGVVMNLGRDNATDNLGITCKIMSRSVRSRTISNSEAYEVYGSGSGGLSLQRLLSDSKRAHEDIVSTEDHG